MAAAFKKSDFAHVSESLAARSALKLSRAANQAKPVASPARELQASLADRLNSPQSPRAGATLGVLAGLIGGTFLTGLLIYAVA